MLRNLSSTDAYCCTMPFRSKPQVLTIMTGAMMNWMTWVTAAMVNMLVSARQRSRLPSLSRTIISAMRAARVAGRLALSIQRM